MAVIRYFTQKKKKSPGTRDIRYIIQYLFETDLEEMMLMVSSKGANEYGCPLCCDDAAPS
jgi:hypothetical protein